MHPLCDGPTKYDMVTKEHAHEYRTLLHLHTKPMIFTLPSSAHTYVLDKWYHTEDA